MMMAWRAWAWQLPLALRALPKGLGYLLALGALAFGFYEAIASMVAKPAAPGPGAVPSILIKSDHDQIIRNTERVDDLTRRVEDLEAKMSSPTGATLQIQQLKDALQQHQEASLAAIQAHDEEDRQAQAARHDDAIKTRELLGGMIGSLLVAVTLLLIQRWTSDRMVFRHLHQHQQTLELVGKKVENSSRH